MLLHTLLRLLDPLISLDSIPNLQITGLCEDSRNVLPGQLFIARPGTQSNGALFARQAQQNGAVAVVAQNPVAGCSLPVINVADAASAGSRLANSFYGDPSSSMRVLGITGTNGKTTTTYLIRQILTKAGLKCGIVGTVEIDNGVTRRPAQMTTPTGIDLAQLLSESRDNSCRAVAMEVSSHALDQGRVAGVQFAAAAFSNLTWDHIDYHGNMENYAAAKARLFESISEDAPAIINDRDPWAWRMIRDCPGRFVRFGTSERCDYRARDYRIGSDGTDFILATPDGSAHVHTALVGKHNIENALMAAAVACETFGLSVHQVAAGLKGAVGAPGRLQQVHCGQSFTVLVDYAHTDDALQNVLTSLRPLCRGKLRVLFGCGGNRDADKRPRMAKVAQELADAVYITSDNPRREDPQTIIDQICAGLSKQGKTDVFAEVDRRRAIERVLLDAHPGDVVLLAGKGHEDYQIMGTEKRHFDDAEEAARVLQSRAAAFIDV